MSSTKRVQKHRLKAEINKRVKIDDEILSSDDLLSDSENLMNNKDDLECDTDFSFHESDSSEKSHDSSSADEYDYPLQESSNHPQKSSENTNNSEETLTNDEPEEINLLRIWAIDSGTPKKNVDSLLKILKKRLLPTIPSCSKTLLDTSNAQYNIQAMIGLNGSLGEFSYMGISQGLLACVNPKLHSDKILRLDFNIDGVKIKKSSSKTMWPVLCRVFYKPLPITYKPFPVLIFYGIGKPADECKYIEDFVIELNSLLENGIVIKSVQFSVQIRTFICDTPARAQMKCVKGHTSFNGCERCDVTAYRVDSTTVYKEFGRRRTDEDFRLFTNIEHHTKASPLLGIEPKVDLVNMFVLDSMHLLYLGIMLRLFQQWISGEKSMKISVEQKNEIDRRINMVKKDIPKEFNRKIRPISVYDNYKAAEHRFFVLYCGPIVLKKVLKKELYDHFLLFHAACRLLSSKEAMQFTTLSRDYLRRFVESASVLYGDKFVSLNVHNLVHLPDDVDYTQCNLNDISAFPFESELGKIKNVLLSPHRTLAQYCRRVHEEKKVMNLVAKVPQEISKIKKKQDVILQVMYRQQTFSTKHPDNSALLSNGQLVKINKILKDNQKIYLEVSKYKILKSVYASPCDSSLLHIYEIESIDNSCRSSIVPIENISTKIIRISLNFASSDEIRSYVVPLLH